MRVLAAWVLGGFVSCVAAGAQEASCTPGVFMPGMVMNTNGRGDAFTASVKSTLEQRLIDGNVIAGEAHAHVYQNSEGWTRTENVNCLRDMEGKVQRQVTVMVYKPKSHETLRWTEGGPGETKVATLMRPVEPTPEERAAQQERNKVAAAARPLRRGPDPHLKSESLGSATIVGLEVTGRRTIHTFEPGEEGNSMPLVTTYEYWTTKDGTTVRWVNDDPRRGKTTSEVEELIKGEPDAALFAPPQGYVLKENVPPVVVPAGSQEATAKAP